MLRKHTAKRYRMVVVFAGILLCALLWGIWASRELTVSFYRVSSEKIPDGESVRVAVLADLHNREYGEGNADLIAQLRELAPDLIVMAGDMFSKGDPDTETVLHLCRELEKLAPVFFGLGNHEGTIIYNEGIRLDQMLTDAGVSVLVNCMEQTVVRGVPILIGGISSSTQIYEEYSKDFVEEFEKETSFKLLIAHVPALFYEKMAESKIDLAVSGHYHGGIVQIPGLGGLYSMEDGFFPRYCNGLFSMENGSLLVSRGLGNSTWVPRINNPPELVIVDICRR